MDSIIKSALFNAEREEQIRREHFSRINLNRKTNEEFGNARILVVGTGGAGNNTVNRLHNIGILGAETIAVNTDKQHLDIVRSVKKILIGKNLTKGLGAGGYPEIGRKAAEQAKQVFQKLFDGADLVFITAGMGGGTGTGSAPIIAENAKEQGSVVIAMVTTPFYMEKARISKAMEGLERLRESCDTVIVLDNNRLVQFVPHLPIEQAFSVADEIIAQSVKGIAETITIPSLINLDYADVKAVMVNGGVAMMGIGESHSQHRVEDVVEKALHSPLLDIDYRGATGSLIHITGGPDLTLGEANRIGELITDQLDPHAQVIWGARISKEMEGSVRIVVIITGVHSSQILGPGTFYQKKPIKEEIGLDYIFV